MLIARKNRADVVFVKADELAVRPAAVMVGQIEGRFIVGNRHQRLDAVLMTFIEEVIVKSQARFIRLFFVAARKNPAPGDGRAEDLEAQFRKEADIFFITMIKIDAFQF